MLVTALENWRFGKGGWGGKKLPDAGSAEGLPARVKIRETGKQVGGTLGRVWETWERADRDEVGGSGGRRCQRRGPDCLSNSTLEFPRVSQICLSHSR